MINITFKAICLVLAAISVAHSQSPAAKSKETPSLVQVHEKDSSAQVTFTDNVKIVRDLDGATEVLFVKRSGVFTAPEDGGAMEKLIMSQKSGTAVNIVADEHTFKIIRVSPADNEKGKAGNSKINGK